MNFLHVTDVIADPDVRGRVHSGENAQRAHFPYCRLGIFSRWKVSCKWCRQRYCLDFFNILLDAIGPFCRRFSCRPYNVVRREALPTTLRAQERGSTSFDIHGILGKCVLNGSLPVMTFAIQGSVVVWTSNFDGPIHSLSTFPASRCAAIAYGSEVALTEVLFNPHRLNEERKHLPKLPSASQFPTKLPEQIATSLCFLRNKDQLLVTYATHGIVYVVPFLSGCQSHTRSHWDISSMSVIRRITPRTCPMCARL